MIKSNVRIGTQTCLVPKFALFSSWTVLISTAKLERAMQEPRRQRSQFYLSSRGMEKVSIEVVRISSWSRRGMHFVKQEHASQVRVVESTKSLGKLVNYPVRFKGRCWAMAGDPNSTALWRTSNAMLWGLELVYIGRRKPSKKFVSKDLSAVVNTSSFINVFVCCEEITYIGKG